MKLYYLSNVGDYIVPVEIEYPSALYNVIVNKDGSYTLKDNSDNDLPLYEFKDVAWDKCFEIINAKLAVLHTIKNLMELKRIEK